MTEDEIILKLEPLLREVLEIPSFDPELDMERVEAWDSLRHINLVYEIEKTFGIRLEQLEMTEMVSLGRVLETVKRRAAA